MIFNSPRRKGILLTLWQDPEFLQELHAIFSFELAEALLESTWFQFPCGMIQVIN